MRAGGGSGARNIYRAQLLRRPSPGQCLAECFILSGGRWEGSFSLHLSHRLHTIGLVGPDEEKRPRKQSWISTLRPRLLTSPKMTQQGRAFAWVLCAFLLGSRFEVVWAALADGSEAPAPTLVHAAWHTPLPVGELGCDTT